MTDDVANKYRHLFPVFRNLSYLNSCSQGALAVPVRDALNEYLDGLYLKGSLWDQWMMKQEELRGLIARAFSTALSNVAITSNASAGINSVLSAFEFSGKKNRIITTDLEFPTMGQILHAQERRGAKVVHVESSTDGLLDLSKLETLLDDRVALIAVTHVCYRNGYLTDIKSVSALGKKYGIPVLVDTYQSSGSMPIDFDDVGADFLVGGFLKYMLGIPGIGFLLAKPGSSLIPTKTGWFAARDIFAMKIDSYDPAIDARRFEEGTPPVPSVYAAVAGLQLLLEVGLENAFEHTIKLHELIRESFEDLGLEIVTPQGRDKHGVMIAIATRYDHEVVAQLEKEKVITSSRSGNVRISPHFYNTNEDVIRLTNALKSLKTIM